MIDNPPLSPTTEAIITVAVRAVIGAWLLVLVLAITHVL
jgi:hypothetical protein